MIAHRRVGPGLAEAIKRAWPALVTLLVGILFISLRLWKYEFDPSALAEVGTRFSEMDPDGTEGYDGQFTLYIARDLSPLSVAEHLDVPAYRYQRILLSLLASLFSFGNPSIIPWMLLVVNLVVHTAAVYSLQRFLQRSGAAEHYALIYGLWVGVILTLGADLHEALAYGFVVIGWLFWRKGSWSGIFLLSLALFAKETVFLFVAAAFLETTLITIRQFQKQISSEERKKILRQTGLFVVFLSVYIIWQLWLWKVFGRPGLGSGGAMATSFEWIPFGGLIKVLPYEEIFLSILALSLPTLIITVWGLIKAGKSGISGDFSAESTALFLNSLMIVFLPFSSFREPWAIVRLTDGLILATVLFSAKHGLKKELNYAMFLIVYLVMLVKML